MPSTNETSLSDGQSLQSKFDMKLSSLINVQNATVYYSDNGNADSNLSNESNGWTTEAKDTSKSYLIVLNSNVEHGQSISFEYKAIVPKILIMRWKQNHNMQLYITMMKETKQRLFQNSINRNGQCASYTNKNNCIRL